jgi:ATP-dependent DNA helicase DinG
MDLPSPPDLEMPDKFKVWRPGQVTAIKEITNFNDGPHLMQVIPTGVGKSLIYMTAAWTMGRRAVVLTSTKALQDQLVKDFGPIGLVEMKGRKAYACIRGDGPTCDHGMCHFGVKCNYRDRGCHYYDQLRTANASKLVVTSYAFWMVAGDKLGHREVIIMDEAHGAPDHLSNQLEIEINLEDLQRSIGSQVQVPRQHDWHDWAWTYLQAVKNLVDKMKVSIANNPASVWRLRQLVGHQLRMENLMTYVGSLVVMEQDGKLFRFNPVHVAPFAKQLLLRDSPFTVLTSATSTAKTGNLIGIEPHVTEYPSNFPPSSRPVIHITPPTSVSVKFGWSKGEEKQWLNLIDRIIGARLDRKGIVHCVSYDRAKLIVGHSQHKAHLRTNASGTTNLTVEQFRRDKPPSVLVSPIMSTGWDFPYEQLEYNIIAKLAFPHSQSAIVKARSKSDPELPFYTAIQQLVQACGRGMRAADDKCETLIVDDNFGWLIRRYNHLVPGWFKETIKKSKTIPLPPPKLKRGL